MVGVVTKIDKVSRERLAEHLLEVAQLLPDRDVVPVSAVARDGVDTLIDLLVARLPEGPMLYPDAESTDEPVETRIAELVREAALDGVRTSCRIRSRRWSPRSCRRIRTRPSRSPRCT